MHFFESTYTIFILFTLVNEITNNPERKCNNMFKFLSREMLGLKGKGKSNHTILLNCRII